VGADDTQAGQAFHFNHATEYEVIPQRLRLGLNGYYLKQITTPGWMGTTSRTARNRFSPSVPGPFHVTKDTHLFFNLYFEMAAENRTEGNRFNLRLVHHF